MRKPKDARHLKFAIGGDEPDPVEAPVRHVGKTATTRRKALRKTVYQGLDGKPRDVRTGRLLPFTRAELREKGYIENEGGPSMTTWIIIGGAVVVAGFAAWYFTRPKTAVPGGANDLSVLPPTTKTTASVPAGSPCAVLQAAVKTAKASGDAATLQTAMVAWNAKCAAYTLGV